MTFARRRITSGVVTGRIAVIGHLENRRTLGLTGFGRQVQISRQCGTITWNSPPNFVLLDPPFKLRKTKRLKLIKSLHWILTSALSHAAITSKIWNDFWRALWIVLSCFKHFFRGASVLLSYFPLLSILCMCIALFYVFNCQSILLLMIYRINFTFRAFGRPSSDINAQTELRET